MARWPNSGEIDQPGEGVQARGGRFIVVRPPIPDRVRKTLPGEDEFDDALAAVLAPLRVDLIDLSRVDNKDEYFYDTDHLNETGTNRWTEHLGNALQQVSAAASRVPPPPSAWSSPRR